MKRNIPITTVGALCALCALSAVSSHAQLTGHWNLEEGSGTSTIEQVNAIGSNSFGTGVTWSTDTPGPASAASLSFPGTSAGNLRTNRNATNLGINGSGAKTITAWIKAPDTNTVTRMFFGWSPLNGVAAEGKEMRIGLDGSGFLRLEVASGFALYSTTALDNNSWHMVGVVIDANDNVNSVQLYIDGNLVNPTSAGNRLINTEGSSADALRNDIYLGIGNTGGTQQWSGLLDDVRVYSSALDETALDAIHTAMSVAPPPPLIWNNASNSSLWDAVSLNWFNGTTNVAFASGDRLSFGDTANGLETISAVGTLTSGNMTFSSATTDYTIDGSGTVAGSGSMTASNGMQLELENTGGLSFSGALNIQSSSTVFLSTARSIGSTSIATGTTLELLDGGSVSGPVSNSGTIRNYGTTGTQGINGVISGNGAIQQSGTGTLALGATNPYTGVVTVNSGVFRLEAGAGRLFQTGAFFGTQNVNNIIVNGGVFECWNWGYGNANALSQLRTNYGQILLNGGTIRLTQTFSNNRPFTVGANGGTIEVTAGNTFTKVAGTTSNENIIRFSANSTLTFSGDGDSVIADALGSYGSTGFSIAKTGAGTLTLSGVNSYSGPTTVSGGTLALNGTSLADSTSLVINGGVVAPTGTETVDQLFFGSIQQIAGTWGATGSGATNIDDTRFSGTAGVILVISNPDRIWNNASTNGLWDAVSVNWNNGIGNVAFADTDNVRFEDSLGSLEIIEVVGTVAPNKVTLSNLLTDFEFGGNGTIAGSGPMLVQNGGFATFSNTGGLGFTGNLTIGGNSKVFLDTVGGQGSTSIANGSSLELLDDGSVNGSIANAGTIINASTTGTQALNSTVSGTGSIQQNGTGTLQFAAENTQTGTVTINSGTAIINPGAKLFRTGSFFGVQNQNYLIVNTGGVFETWNWDYGISNALAELRNNYGQILLNGGTIRFSQSSSALRAFTVGANGGTIEVTSGMTYTKQAGTTGSENIIRFSANSTLTIGGAGDTVIGDALGAYGSTGFGITKTGAGTLTLSGANTYTGPTTLSGGTLALNGTSLADASSLVITAGVAAPTNTETVNTLFFGAAQQLAGTWGATGSGATNIDDTRFSGTDGVLLVTTGPVAGYASWATANGTAGTIDQDHDNDGVPNGIEYFIGGPNGNTTGFTVLPGVTNTGGILSITWTMAADYTGSYDTDFVVETSETLAGAWTEETLNVNVIIAGDDVTYTFPAGPTKKFVRLTVTGP